ncbi:cell division protein FtsA [Aurantiacibacter rhizosphaerae]|uniref:Cell division protein FtsA n=1 Tax=Aurantiacibacter rhizosphaerae TaxID=2691582 RepID=A0A844XGS0_9SPHN|nr:cell division protein FtsA [Aurantiacibacter rhizosphaerae]MWV28923.1 cell division protein FtsA [Aurantiacibacter rhizosphaerae]
MTQVSRIIAAWWRTRRAMRRSPAALAAGRARAWAALQPALARTPALASFTGGEIEDFPITDIADVRRDYGLWNSLGLSDATLRAMANAAEDGAAASPTALSAGWSTGSSGGARGLFVASPAERAEYIGQSLARLLPARAMLRRQRIALYLRAGNALYSDAGRGRFAFRHLPLGAPLAETIDELQAFASTILIAPPHRLIALAEAGVRLPALRHLFCGSEPISAAERAFIADRLGHAPRAIYQATEGFLGAECAQGRLHLNDHVLAIELEPVAGTPGVRPIITDLKRTSQPVVRLRGDDYLELDPRVCPCGFAGRVIAPVEGRIADIWPGEAGPVTPPQIVAAVERLLGAGHRWQAVGRTAKAVLRVAPECPPALASDAADALSACVARPVTVQQDLPEWSGPKRRKVMWADA